MTWQISSGSNSEPYSVYTRFIRQGETDHRQLRLIRLQNEMQVLLVHDVNSPIAAVSLCLSVGSLHDPVDRPGLAHFCEHVREEYLNSDKYPTGRIGSDEAATDFRETSYESTVDHDALEDKIQRFASFLSHPVFHKNVLFEQVLCVQSEFQNYLQDDERRIADLDKYLSKSGDPWRAFDIGNWETLTASGKVPPSPASGKGDESGEWIDTLHSKLQEWYTAYYCGNRMHLVIIGSHPIDELTSLATKYFSPVTAGTVGPQASDITFESPWSPDEEGTVVLVKTVKELREIEVRWIMPSQTLLYRVKPLNYLTRFLHHQGEGSLYSILRGRGWIDRLWASRCEGDRERGFETYHVAFTVTESGWHAWEAVVAALHKYISLVRESVIKDPEFARSVQQELCLLSELHFRFRETLKPHVEANLLSSNLAKGIPPADLIIGPYVTEAWDAPLVSTTLAMLTPCKARVTLKGREILKDVELRGTRVAIDGAAWSQTPWFNTEHIVLRYAGSNWSTYSSDDAAVEGLHLFGPNPYVPEDFTVVGGKKDGVKPILAPRKIVETSLSELWYKLDDRFGESKASVTFDIKSDLEDTPRGELFDRILDKLLNDHISEDVANAAQCFLKCSFYCQAGGLFVTISGFSDKIPVLLRVVINKVANFVVSPDSLQLAQDYVRRRLQNAFLSSPVDTAEGTLNYLLEEDATASVTEKLGEMDAVNVSAIQKHLSDIVKQVYILGLVHGNLTEKCARDMLQLVQDVLRCGNLSPTASKVISRRNYLLPEGCNLVYDAPVNNKADENSGLAWVCQIGEKTSAPLRARLTLFARFARTLLSGQLQMAEALGYTFKIKVHGGSTTAFRVSIQSSTHSPAYLEQRLEACLIEQVRQRLLEIQEHEFERNFKLPLARGLRPQPANVHREANMFWKCIAARDTKFNLDELVAQSIESLKPIDVLQFFDEYIDPRSSTRRKLSVHLRSVRHAPPVTPSLDLRAFRSTLFPNNTLSKGHVTDSDKCLTVEY
ncbi:Metalloenzyme, LuxS/M16 peptidase-like protein [Gautieria morchelliformis]|nr:Metalloenzyme, LuxS/M16 peptidase-like protein [Gautieria morchelliformis]